MNLSDASETGLQFSPINNTQKISHEIFFYIRISLSVIKLNGNPWYQFGSYSTKKKKDKKKKNA